MMENMTVGQIEFDLGFRFTEEERRRLRRIHHPRERFYDGEVGWRMSGPPLTLYISHGPVGLEALAIFRGHSHEMEGKFWVRYGNFTEIYPYAELV